MNPFEQHIGIYYKDYDWAVKLHDKICEDTAKYITWISKAMFEMHILFADGSYVRFIPANDSSRGCRFTKAYMQEGISLDKYNNIIAPKILGDGECYVIKGYNDLRPFVRHVKAKDYYRKLLDREWHDVEETPREHEWLIVKDKDGKEYKDHYWSFGFWDASRDEDGGYDAWRTDVDIEKWRYE